MLDKQCLHRRFADYDALRREVASWQRRRHSERARVNRLFDVHRAREKLDRVYPNPLCNELAHAA